MPDLSTFLQELGLRDLLDVLIVALCLYFVLKRVQGTRAMQILQGLTVLVVLYFGVRFSQLKTLYFLVNGLLVSTVVALPVVFQPELRRLLMHLGQPGMLAPGALRGLGKEELGHLVDELAFAASQLSLSRHGALVVLEQETGLGDIIEGGHQVGGLVSAKLLQAIFHPKTPLHDGAVVLRGRQLVAAACYLPNTEQSVEPRFGTRHRAALGITEQSDSVVLVVSEETGEVRLAHEGRFSRPMTEEAEIKKALNLHLASESPRGNLGRLKLTRTLEGSR